MPVLQAAYCDKASNQFPTICFFNGNYELNDESLFLPFLIQMVETDRYNTIVDWLLINDLPPCGKSY